MTDTTMQVLRMLVNAYPRTELADKTIPLYDELLADIPPDILKAAVLDHVSESVFFPAIAELRKRSFKLMAPDAMDAYEAWGKTLEYVRAGRGHPIVGKREWDIPPEIEQAVRGVGGWQLLAMTENITADRMRFVEAYDRTLAKQEYLTRQLPQLTELTRRLSSPLEALEVEA